MAAQTFISVFSVFHPLLRFLQNSTGFWFALLVSLFIGTVRHLVGSKSDRRAIFATICCTVVILDLVPILYFMTTTREIPALNMWDFLFGWAVISAAFFIWEAVCIGNGSFIKWIWSRWKNLDGTGPNRTETSSVSIAQGMRALFDEEDRQSEKHLR